MMSDFVKAVYNYPYTVKPLYIPSLIESPAYQTWPVNLLFPILINY